MLWPRPAEPFGSHSVSDSSWLWAVFTLIAAAAQTVRNAAQRELTGTLGTVGATHVRWNSVNAAAGHWRSMVPFRRVSSARIDAAGEPAPSARRFCCPGCAEP